RLHLERLTIPAEVEAVALRAEIVAPLDFRQGRMFDAELGPGHEVAALIERLNSRLGEQAVLRPRLCADPQPEFACAHEPWLFPPSPLAGEGKGVRGK